MLAAASPIMVGAQYRCMAQVDSGCCTDDNPCEEGDGDCDYNSHCKGDLVCGKSNCAEWGTIEDDCCCDRNGWNCEWEEDPEGCFSLYSLATLPSGHLIPLSKLKKGDLVKSLDGNGQEIFTPFLGWLDKDSSKVTPFLKLTTENSSSVVLTAHHFLMSTPDPDHPSEMKRADEVAEGDFLLTSSGLERVSSISRVTERGRGSPLTMTGDLLINGVLSSNYAHAPSHSIAHLWMTPFRWFDLLSNSDTKKENFVRRYSKLGSWAGDLVLEFLNKNDQVSGKVPNNNWNIPTYLFGNAGFQKV